MVVMTIKLYKDSAGALLAEFLNGINSVSQNNSNVNKVLVVLDNFELAVGEVLRIGYELSTGEEVEDYTLMKDNFDGTYSAEIPYAVEHSEQGAVWQLGLQIASNWVENQTFTGYWNKQNLVRPLEFEVNNAVRDRNGQYPKMGDITTLYLVAQEKIEREENNAEKIENVKTQVTEIETNVEALGVQVFKNTEAIKAFVGGGEFAVIPVVELPTENINTSALYLLKTGTDSEENIYTEYLYVNGKWEIIGTMSVAVDLTDYVKVTDRDNFVKEGLTDNKEPWMDEDKAKACETIGAVKKPANSGAVAGLASAVIVDKDNNVSSVMITEFGSAPYTIAKRGSRGEVKVAIPEKNNDATNKDYVENLPNYLTMTDEQKAKWLSMFGITTETWTFTLEDGTTVAKKVAIL